MTTTTIILPIGCTAERDTCGSCHYFKREGSYGDDYRSYGYCKFKMPPLKERYVIKPYDEKTDENWGPGRLTDTDRCDFWKHSGATYIVQRRIQP